MPKNPLARAPGHPLGRGNPHPARNGLRHGLCANKRELSASVSLTLRRQRRVTRSRRRRNCVCRRSDRPPGAAGPALSAFAVRQKYALARRQNTTQLAVVVGHFWRAKYGNFSRVPKHLPAKALEGADPIPAAARRAVGQQRLRAGPETRGAAPPRMPCSTAPCTTRRWATCS
jgi:hypothetical protein